MSRRRRRYAVAAVALALPTMLLGACGGSGGTDPPPRADLTVRYAPELDESVYLPDRPGRVPLVVMVPGGGWSTADPTGLRPLAERLADAGIAAAPARIRAAADGAGDPEPRDDVRCAVASAAQAIRGRGFEAHPVVVLGHSSGAHLAALAVLAYDDYVPRCQAPPVEPDGLIGLAGPYDISRVPDLAAALMGGDPEDDPSAWEAANPVRRADLRPCVPVLLLHGRADETVPPSSTEGFADALRAAGHRTTLDLLPGVDHARLYSADVAAEPVARWVFAPWMTGSSGCDAPPRR